MDRVWQREIYLFHEIVFHLGLLTSTALTFFILSADVTLFRLFQAKGRYHSGIHGS